MIITKTCNTCEHSLNDKYCIGCEWNKSKGENTKWELKNNPIVIERKVLDKIRAEIKQTADEEQKHDEKWALGLRYAVKIIDKYRNEVSE